MEDWLIDTINQAAAPVAKYIGPPASFHTAVGRQREVLVRLKQPLGARVLVDLDSSPAEDASLRKRIDETALDAEPRACGS